MLLDNYHTGLMEDIDANPESDSGEACVADDFGYVCLDKGKRKLVNVVDGFQAQRGDKSRATLQTMMETAHSLLFPCAGD